MPLIYDTEHQILPPRPGTINDDNRGPHQDVRYNSLEAGVIITHHGHSAQKRHSPSLHREGLLSQALLMVCTITMVLFCSSNLSTILSISHVQALFSRSRVPTLPSCSFVPLTSVHRSTAIIVMPLSCRLPG